MDWLRKNGVLVGGKKTDRLASEGAIAADCVGGFGALIEISSETDFVARGDQFKGLVSSVLGVAMARSETVVDRLIEHPFDSENHKRGTIGECVLEFAGTIGENIVLRRLVAHNVNPVWWCRTFTNPFQAPQILGHWGFWWPWNQKQTRTI
jgi:elongation factor Ts